MNEVSKKGTLEYGYGDKKQKASPVASTNDPEVIKKAKEKYTPVSYTHLDVYKRQVEGRAEGQNLLVAVVNRLRNGETAEHIMASGVYAQTVALAQSIK